MDCRRIEHLMPLYVEGDLEADQARKILSHLNGCARCSKLVVDYQESRLWVQSFRPPDFDGKFFDDLKRSVLSEIDKTRSRPAFFRLMTVGWTWNQISLATLALLIAMAVMTFYIYTGKTKE